MVLPSTSWSPPRATARATSDMVISGPMPGRTTWPPWVWPAIDQLGDGCGANPAALSTVMLAERHAVMEAIEVVDLATAVLGGRAYFRSSPLGRAARDVRAGVFHPFTPEVTLAYAGKLALGDPGLTE